MCLRGGHCSLPASRSLAVHLHTCSTHANDGPRAQCKLQVASCKLQAASCKLQVASRGAEALQLTLSAHSSNCKHQRSCTEAIMPSPDGVEQDGLSSTVLAQEAHTCSPHQPHRADPRRAAAPPPSTHNRGVSSLCGSVPSAAALWTRTLPSHKTSGPQVTAQAALALAHRSRPLHSTTHLACEHGEC